MRLGGWSILMPSCRGRTPPHCCSWIYVVGERAKVPAVYHHPHHWACWPKLSRLCVLILIAPRYLNPHPAALISVIPHFTQSQSMALCRQILPFFLSFPERANHKTEGSVCEPNNKSFIYTEAWITLKERLVLSWRVTQHSQQVRVLLLTFYWA